MKTVYHSADSRGEADHGWLYSRHTFSFADYWDSDRVNFGVLRVLNDDTIQGGTGFGTHPHSNMEIVSIPLEGALEHKDSMGNVSVIRKGEIQVMSAGTGITHSEYNKNKDLPAKFLQIWIFPNQERVEPRYDHYVIDDLAVKNQLGQILSPNEEDQGVWIYQQAWFYLGRFDPGIEIAHELKNTGNGIYLFVISGEVMVEGKALYARDGYGIWDCGKINIRALTPTEILLMEVPV